MPRREASEPLGNESAMNVFATSLRDNNTNKKSQQTHSFYRDRYLIQLPKTDQLSNHKYAADQDERSASCENIVSRSQTFFLPHPPGAKSLL